MYSFYIENNFSKSLNMILIKNLEIIFFDKIKEFKVNIFSLLRVSTYWPIKMATYQGLGVVGGSVLTWLERRKQSQKRMLAVKKGLWSSTHFVCLIINWIVGLDLEGGVIRLHIIKKLSSQGGAHGWGGGRNVTAYWHLKHRQFIN